VWQCPACQEGLASLQEAKSITLPKERIGDGEDFWWEFLSRVDQPTPQTKTRFRPQWRWAFGTLGLAVFLAAGVFMLTRSPQNKIPDLALKLKINYIQFYDKPAQAIIFQTQDATKTFVWVENQNQNQGETP
jgi:hypothetical protein